MPESGPRQASRRLCGLMKILNELLCALAALKLEILAPAGVHNDPITARVYFAGFRAAQHSN